MNLNTLYEQLIARENLTPVQMEQVMLACVQNKLSESQITVFLALMRMKGETIDELTTAAKVLLQFARPIDLGPDLIDIVGTGGDNKNTFNVSTISSIVVASAGVRVAKHGSYSVSSRSGSSNLLEHAGVKLQLNNEQLQHCLEKVGLCFLLGPHFHPALQHVRGARAQLGIRSFFNILGPLINPARPKKQLVGVFDAKLLTPVAKILANLGSERAFVCHSRDGLDEFSIAAITDVVELNHGQYHSWWLNPQDYGFYHDNLDSILVNSPEESLKLMRSVLAGEKGAARDMILLNSAAAIYLANHTDNMATAINYAEQAIDSGKAQQHFELLIEITRC